MRSIVDYSRLIVRNGDGADFPRARRTRPGDAVHALPRRGSPKGNLSLTTGRRRFKGGDSGPAVVPGKPDESLLLEMISGDPPAMPQKDEPLSQAEVASIRNWIDGAPLARRASRSRTAGSKARRWWAVRALEAARRVRSEVDRRWVRTPIDAFILAELEQEGLAPAPRPTAAP